MRTTMKKQQQQHDNKTNLSEYTWIFILFGVNDVQ